MRTSPTLLPPGRPRSRGRRLVAAALAALLAAAGVTAGASPAVAATTGPAVSAPEVPAAGGTITVTGSGFATDAPGIYLGVGPAGLPGFYQGSSSMLPSETVWVALGNPEVGSGTTRTSPMNADGSFAVSVTIPAASTGTPAYAVYTSKAHGQGFADPSQNTVTPLAYAAPEPASTSVALTTSAATVAQGASLTLTATVSPVADGTIEFRDGGASLGSKPTAAGSAALSTTALTPGTHTITAAFTPSDTAAYAASTSAASTVTVTATPTPSVTVTPSTALNPEGASLAVSGTGFATTGPGFYLGVGPKSATSDPNWYRTAAHFQAVKWATVAGSYGVTIQPDGSFSATLANVKAVFASNGRAVDCRTEECGLFTFAAHGSADRGQDTYAPISFTTPAETTLTVVPSTASAVEGTAVTLTATVTPSAVAGSVEFFDGSVSLGSGSVVAGTASISASALAVGSHAITATFTPADASTATPATAAAVTVVVTAAVTPGTPRVTVTPATGIDPEAGLLTVSGTGFATTGVGFYLGVGPKAALNDPNWFVNADYFQATAWATTAGTYGPKIQPDGSLSYTITGLTQVFTAHGRQVDCGTEECGVFTFAAHGSANRGQDTYTPIAFSAPAAGAVRTSLALRVSSATSNPGDPVDVTVTITPAADGTVTLYDRGSVVARLRLTADSAPAGVRTLALAASTGSASVTARVPALASGSHAFTASFTPDDPSAFAPSVSPAVGHDVKAAAVETVATPQAPSAAAEPVCVARTVSGATLDWGVKSSFRTYISGGIANGAWTLSGVTYADGRYGWSGGSGSVNPTESRGLVRYPGTVSFSGHGGVLNLVLSNLAVRVTSATSATLIADVHSTDMSGTPADAKGIGFATLALGGSTTSGSALAVNGAPAVLTEAGAKAFAGFYPAGTELDPVSFRLPFGSQVACDSTTAAAGSALASTGSAGAGEWPLLAGLLTLAGIAAVAVARRRLETR